MRFNKLIFMKKLSLSIAAVSALLTMTAGISYADKPTTYLAPKYQSIEIAPDKIYVSVLPSLNNGRPYEVELSSEFEKIETAVNKGLKVEVAPEGSSGEMLPYLVKSPEMTDSFKLRVIARLRKLEMIQASGNAAYAEFYKNYVKSPIALMINAKLGTGPACGPIPLHLSMKDGKYYFFNTVTIIEDIPKLFIVEDALKNDTLDMVIAHENAHGIMFDIYGNQIGVIKKQSNMGHDGPIVSDRGLAFIEGWAEAFEAIYGPNNPLLKLKEDEREKYRISEFLFTRQDPVRRDRYIWQNYKGKKTGILKNGVQILSTEGAIAGLFYDILTSKSLKEPFVKSISVMYAYKPKDFIEFINGWVRNYPEDKNIIYRIFLEGTNYATVSNEARKLYYDYYQAKLAYVQKKMDEESFYKIKGKWTTYKENLFAETMQNGNLSSNVAPDLWFEIKDFPISLKALLAKILGTTSPHINLAAVTPEQLNQLKSAGLLKELSDEDIEKIISVRESYGIMPYKTATEALKEMLGTLRAKLIIFKNGIEDIK